MNDDEKEIDCKGYGRGPAAGGAPYWEIRATKDMPAKLALTSYAELSERGGLKIDGEMVHDPLYVIGEKPLQYAKNVAKTKGNGEGKVFGTAVCWQLAAAGITALIDAFNEAEGYEGARIW